MNLLSFKWLYYLCCIALHFIHMCMFMLCLSLVNNVCRNFGRLNVCLNFGRPKCCQNFERYLVHLIEALAKKSLVCKDVLVSRPLGALEGADHCIRYFAQENHFLRSKKVYIL